jgi:hypothetical protein
VIFQLLSLSEPTRSYERPDRVQLKSGRLVI